LNKARQGGRIGDQVKRPPRVISKEGRNNEPRADAMGKERRGEVKCAKVYRITSKKAETVAR
jgi:hypothetical protein